MNYRKLFQQENKDAMEVYDISLERIRQIPKEHTVSSDVWPYFDHVASFALKTDELLQLSLAGRLEIADQNALSLEEFENWNETLFAELTKDYEHSYLNPAYACGQLGLDFGRLLSFLYSEMRALIPYAYEGRLADMSILLSLFVQVYNLFEDAEGVTPKQVQNVIYWAVSDYADITVDYRIRELLDPELSFATDIIMKSDLTDPRYLYQYGEYISENEMQTAAFLNTLSEEEVQKLADTFTEGYRRGFELAGKNLSAKKTVDIRYAVGFERVIRKAIANFAEMGLKPVIYRQAYNRINRRLDLAIGYLGAVASPQYEFDHRMDEGVFINKDFSERKLGVVRTAYEKYKDLAAGMAGPAVMDIFGAELFLPKAKEENIYLNKVQSEVLTRMRSANAQIVNSYIKGEERSFTIIAFPIPAIGADYETIFRETAKINTLNPDIYQKIQQTLIDALDQADHVHITGSGENQTDLVVKLHTLQDPEKETNFENCLADVNIPLGEVFTSPQLAGTTGLLHVSKVYLNDRLYLDLKVWLTDGMVTDYTCSNFEKEEDNRAYIHDNVLFGHESLPIGEFAIGTNTTAYAMAEKYQILKKLPILIVEKMGPHFALGDTCYSFEEDHMTYNPDGKAIVARENEVSALRKTDPKKAYFNCHTDITIPYDELGEITAVAVEADGKEKKIPLIKDGRFVLPGTELLNEPLEK